MGLMSFIRNQLIDIVEWIDNTNYTLVWRFPDEDHEIKNGAKLICREGQAAILVSEGQMADVFGPGTHTLSTQNIPVLSSLRGWSSGFESPYKVEVYFVNLRQYLDQKWGTPTPIIIRDPEFGVAGRPGKIRIRAFGNYNFRITDPEKFFKEVVGTNGLVSTDDIERFIKTRVLTQFGQAAAKSGISVADMYAHVETLTAAVEKGIADDLSDLGIALTGLVIESINLPPEIEKALDEAAIQAARGIDNTMAWEGMSAMRDMAKNAHKGQGNSMMNAGMGVGMGAGMGNMMGNMMQQAMNPQAAPSPAAPSPQAAAPAQLSLQEKLTKLKSAYEAELLTEEEYAAKKSSLLDSF